MVETYNALEGSISVRGTGTSSRTGTSNGVAIIGGHDSSNAASEVTAGEATYVNDPTNAEDTFGTSELPRAIELASANGVGDIYGTPVSETSNTESFTATQSMTLSETPIFNPQFHPDHSITVTDTSSGSDLTTNIVYDETPATPSETDTANVNPINGKVECDGSSDYDVSYTYGDYSTAISAAADLGVRYLIVLTESPSVKASVASTLSDIANDFDFKRAFVNATPEIDTGSIGSYTPDEQNWRIVETAPAIATGADGTVRTCAAVGGFMAGQPIGPDGSGLYDPIGGLVSLNTEYRASEAKDFQGQGVSALTRNGVLASAETTSDTEQFRLIYGAEIIDDVAENLFAEAEDYAGGPQNITDLENRLSIVCQSATEQTPPLLGFGAGSEDSGTPYDVQASLGADPGVANASVTIVPYPIAEEVNINLTATDGFVGFDGVTA